MGFDILALRTLLARGHIVSVGSQIGVGKESDIFEALTEDGEEIVLKLHRLGRTSFRSVRRNRDYMKGKNKASWLYMSRLAAIKEYAFMQALHKHGFPTPTPIDQNRHVVAMSKVNGFPMAQIKSGNMYGAGEIFERCVKILIRLAECGLVHCDYNEFNLMISTEGVITLIDFPQMISTTHPNASELFQRDFNGLVKFFAMKMRFIPTQIVTLRDVTAGEDRIDEEVRGCEGFSREEDEILMQYISEQQVEAAEAGEGGTHYDVISGIKCKNVSGEEDEEDEEDEEERDAPQLVGDTAGGTVFGFGSAAVEKDAGDADADAGSVGSLDGSLGLDSGEEDGGAGVGAGAGGPPGWRTSEGDGRAQAARDDIREKLRRGKGGRRQQGGGSRNATKKISLYGKKVKTEKLEY